MLNRHRRAGIQPRAAHAQRPAQAGGVGTLLTLMEHLPDHFNSRAKTADAFSRNDTSFAQPLVLALQLADVLLLCRQRLADARLTGLLGAVLVQPTAHRAVEQIQVRLPGPRSGIGRDSSARAAD